MCFVLTNTNKSGIVGNYDLRFTIFDPFDYAQDRFMIDMRRFWICDFRFFPLKREDSKFFVLLFLCAFVPLWLDYSAYACSTPVFRYAMERWPADYYEAVVIHKGPLADDDPAAVLLQGEKVEFLNLRVSPIDLDNKQGQDALATTGDLTGLLSGYRVEGVSPSNRGLEAHDTLPALVLWYPNSYGRAAPFWTGRFNSATVEAMIQSPKRQELARRLTAGQTTVWIFVESGNAGKDKAAMQLISRELDTATKELKEMPPLATSGGEELATPEFSYEFSILPVSRSDPKEKMLLEILLNSEPDLDEYSNEPIVFPTFGRGRTLFALVGEGINAENLREAIAFITGPCGCEIKMLNPGVDLLMAENWDAAAMQFYQEFYETAEETLPELTGVFPEESAGASLNAQDELIANRRWPVADFKSKIGNRKSKIHWFGLMGTTAVSLAAILVAVGLGTFAVTRRKHSN
jgi:hypothetical protein